MHVRNAISPQNSGTLTDVNNITLHVAPNGTCWSDGQQIGQAYVSRAVELDNGQVYACGLKSGEWWHFSQRKWVPPSAEVTAFLRRLA